MQDLACMEVPGCQNAWMPQYKYITQPHTHTHIAILPCFIALIYITELYEALVQ